jgi:hypothetical protein
MNRRSFLSILAVGILIARAQSLAQSLGAGVYVSRTHDLLQNGTGTVVERQVSLTISIFTLPNFPAGGGLDLHVNDRIIPMSRNSPVPLLPSSSTIFTYSRAFANSAELNSTYPAINYTAVSWGITPTVTYPVAITPSVLPSFRVINFEALQMWNGGDLEIRWIPLNATDAVDLGVWRANGERIYTGRTSEPAGAPISLPYLLPGTGEHSIHGITASPGEVLTARISYGATTSFGFLSLLPAPTSPVRATLEFSIQRPPLPPVIATQPRSGNALGGDDVSLTVEAVGTSLTYQWRKDGTDMNGATNAILELRSAQPTDSGSYTVVVANTGGSVTSQAAVVTITPRIVAPAITASPVAQTITAGAKATLSLTATGTPPFTYQWLRNGSAIAGATQSTLTFDRARPSDAGQYSVTVTNSAGSITSSAGELKVNPVSRISNLSILTSLSSASDNFTLGFVVTGTLGGDAATAKPVLIRAVGPSLTPLGVLGALDDPQLELFAGASVVAANDNWNGDAALSDAFAAAGAFAFANATSRDAAILARVTGSNSSVKISGTGSGTVLAELYDGTAADDFGIASPRFANVSVLKPVGAGLTAGFVIAGAAPLRLLVRAIGPTLASFGVSGALADPKLDLFQSGNPTAIAGNDNWIAASNSGQVAAAAVDVGAFALAADSKDAVLLVTLPPGSYTAQVNGVGGTTGVALVEVYEVP